jgi:hypothetical protein
MAVAGVARVRAVSVQLWLSPAHLNFAVANLAMFSPARGVEICSVSFQFAGQPPARSRLFFDH